eukprot:gene20677-4726_t
MINRVGCEAPDLFAALAPVAGPIANGSSHTWGSDPYACPPPPRPIPTLYFQGTTDTLVPWKGNPLLGFPSIESYIDTLKQRNGIAGSPGSVSYAHGDVTCTTYGPNAANVTLCRHPYGHCWPGRTTQGPCTKDVDATAQIGAAAPLLRALPLWPRNGARRPAPARVASHKPNGLR